MNIKRLVTLAVILLFSGQAFAQFENNPRENSTGGRSWIHFFRGDRKGVGISRPRGGGGGGDVGDYKKNAVKLNISALGVRNISLQYERLLRPKIGFDLGVRTTIPGGFPVFGSSTNAAGQTSTYYDNLKVSSISLTPEVRRYFGKKAGSGFYLGILGKYDKYTIKAPRIFVEDDNTTTNINMQGSTQFIGGGLSLGMQFKIKEIISFDWWLFNPMYGSRNVELKATSTNFGLSQADLDEIKAENPLKNFEPVFGKSTSVVTNQEISYKISGALPAARVGFCIGFLF